MEAGVVGALDGPQEPVLELPVGCVASLLVKNSGHLVTPGRDAATWATDALQCVIHGLELRRDPATAASESSVVRHASENCRVLTRRA